MQLLISLARFGMDESLVKKRIAKLGKHVEFISGKDFLTVQGEKFELEKIKALPEVSKIFVVTSNWKAFSFAEVAEMGLRALKLSKSKKYKIGVSLYGKLDLSSKSIYKKINASAGKREYSEKDFDTLVYVEVIKKVGVKQFRVSYAKRDWMELKVEKFDYPFLVVLEEPTLVSEVADFLRVCWVFGVQLMLLGDVDPSIIDKARQETKNVPKEFKVLVGKRVLSGYAKFGFSKHAPASESDLIKEFKKVKKVALVIGNEKFGLSQEARYNCDKLFRFGKFVSKPLKGSQTLSFVLGMFRGV